MQIRQALSLTDGDKVRIRYTPVPGYGVAINEVGTVKGTVTGPVYQNNIGTEYVWVRVYVPSQTRSSVFPSHCLGNI